MVNIGNKEFKKYALLEAKQYKNIYRTIQNVFSNTQEYYSHLNLFNLLNS